MVMVINDTTLVISALLAHEEVSDSSILLLLLSSNCTFIFIVFDFFEGETEMYFFSIIKRLEMFTIMVLFNIIKVRKNIHQFHEHKTIPKAMQ